MMQPTAYSITPLGDSALLIYFGNIISEGINEIVLRLFHQLKELSVPGIIDIVPAYGSLALYYDVAAFYKKGPTAFEVIKEEVVAVLGINNDKALLKGRSIRLPVCYQKKWAPDLEALAGQKSLSTEEVIGLHSASTYRVYMIGFLPGFAYMGSVDDRIATARKHKPVVVTAGSVGIAGEQTGIYPFASPGGWHIIGRTPVKLFDRHQPQPVLLQPGDAITFYPITEHELENYKSRTS